MNDKKLTTALLSGLAGAAALTALHETVRRIRSDAPRMDTLGRRAIAKGLEAAGLETPREDQPQAVALGGDIVANTLCYSLACLGKPSLARGGPWRSRRAGCAGPGSAHGAGPPPRLPHATDGRDDGLLVYGGRARGIRDSSSVGGGNGVRPAGSAGRSQPVVGLTRQPALGAGGHCGRRVHSRRC
jgi:hypothetical protein